MKYNLKTALTVSTYEKFHEFVAAFAKGKIPLLLIIGEAGIAKSQSVRRALRKETCWIEGQATPVSIYELLYRHKHKPVVIDDVDSLYSNDSARRLLKSLCQTDREKEVSWNTQNNRFEDEGIPKSFITRSNVCIITNEWRTFDAHTAAIEDRAVTVIFKPSALEVHGHVATWFDDQETFDFLGSILSLIESPSNRHYIFARSLRQAKIKAWRDLTIERVAHETLIAVAQIKNDPILKTEDQRALEFKARGLGTRATYFRWIKRLPETVEAPLLKLRTNKRRKRKVTTVSKSHVRPRLRLAK